ncbi:MAG: metal-dependent transcriptional regulator [Planctomycetota bacterium]|nr:metal-dependent transcriptional regulator [Planctomycetota bacterium]
MPSLTIENYVKTIYDICIHQGENPAATGQIAQILDVLPGTVTSMMKTLSESGLATYRPYEGVILTASGTALALRVIRRHRLIELFLVRTLNLCWDEVHAEAENMEHAVSDLLIDRIDAFLGFPELDPHGDPIPKADGTVSSNVGTKLSDVQTGTTVRLIRVLDQQPDFLRFLSSVGMDIGVQGLVRSSDVSKDVELKVDEQVVTISCTAADKLLVEVV